MDGQDTQAKQLWDKYYTITTELLKFFNTEDIDEFLELVRQRTVIFDRIQALPEDNYRHTPEGEALVGKIRPLDMQIIYKAKSWLNKSKRQNVAVKSYDLMGMNPLGHRFNKKY